MFYTRGINFRGVRRNNNDVYKMNTSKLRILMTE